MDAVFEASRGFRTWMRESSGLSVAQFRVLLFISRRNGCSLAELKDYLGVSAPSASRMVEALRERGLVMREEDRDDRRRVRLTLTDAGRDVLARSREIVLKRIEERLGGSADEALRCASVLARLVAQG